MNIRTKPKFINKHAKPSTSWLNKLDEYKNLAIITGFLSYIIGFILWSLYLWYIDAGYVYIYDFNLIMSGFLPTLLLMICFFFKNPSAIMRKLKLIFIKNYKKIKKTFAYLVVPIGLILLYQLVVFENNNYIETLILIFDITIILLFIFLGLSIGSINNNITNKYYLTPLFISLFISFFCFIEIPQEFGGVKPRWVGLDINTQEFSNETLGYLDLNRETKISSTRPLMLLYSNSDFILIKKSTAGKAIMIKTRYVNSIKSVSSHELRTYKLSIKEAALKATCSLVHVPAGLSCDQFVYPPLKKPVT